jgi:AraC-like DNA-binding protein
MKIEKTEITPRLNSYISVNKREERFFQSPFHYHPELELVYVLESNGKRIIGNSVEPFEAGDMIFLGSNIPHVWLNDEMYYRGIGKLKAKAIVIYFNKDIFGHLFYELNETKKIGTLFSNATRGISINGKTNILIAQKLKLLLKRTDFDIIVGLFEILSILSDSKDLKFINTESYTPAEDNSKNDRLSIVFSHVKEHYMEDITLQSISKIAHLTPPSFCRLFKARTKKHFVEYLSEVRISNACRYLMESDRSISEVAYICGYKTVSNFNKLFKKITGLTPQAYKKNATG